MRKSGHVPGSIEFDESDWLILEGAFEVSVGQHDHIVRRDESEEKHAECQSYCHFTGWIEGGNVRIRGEMLTRTSLDNFYPWKIVNRGGK